MLFLKDANKIICFFRKYLTEIDNQRLSVEKLKMIPSLVILFKTVF